MSDQKVQVLSFDDSTSVSFKGGLNGKQKREFQKKIESAEEIYAKKRAEREEAEYKGSEFYHGDGNSASAIKKVKQMRHRTHLTQVEELAKFSTLTAHHASQVLLPSEVGGIQAHGINKTWQFSQQDILDNTPEGAKHKSFALDLPDFGPYFVDYTRNGRHMLLAGRKGHIAVFDWQSKKLAVEFNVEETIRDIKMLQNEMMFAVAQKKCVYIYDNQGIELHAMRHHVEPTRLDYLPYHFLLTSTSKNGMLRYQDISTGTIIAEHKTRLGECNVMAQNPQNAIIQLGHNNGMVTLWSPNMTTALVKMHCHNAPIKSIAIDQGGHHLVTAGLDGKVTVWDLRTYRELHSYFTTRPASTMSISATGMLAMGFGPHVQIWRDALRTKQPSPYLYEQFSGKDVCDIQFCPFEDVLGVGYSQGFKSLLMPGAGEANFDTFEANPFQTKKQRADSTVRSLLEKLQPDMITLDTNAFGVMNKDNSEISKKEQQQALKESRVDKVDLERNRMKGGNKNNKRERRKRKNIIDEKLLQHRERVAAREEARKAEKANQAKSTDVPSALDRFRK